MAADVAVCSGFEVGTIAGAGAGSGAGAGIDTGVAAVSEMTGILFWIRDGF